MRTRFLNVDYFNSAPIQEFLSLPLPQIPSSDFQGLHDLSCFDNLSALPISLDIEKLPIDGALSKFLYDVFPHTIDVSTFDFTVDRCCSLSVPCDHRNQISQQIIKARSSEDEDEVLFEKTGCRNKRLKSSKTAGLEVHKEDIALDEAVFGTLQFEIPELHLSLEDSCFSSVNKMLNFTEILDTEISADMDRLEGSTKNFFDFQTSIYSVDNISPEYCLEQKTYLLEDSVLFEGQSQPHSCLFPLLEIDDTSLDICSNISVDHELIITNIELQEWTQKDEAYSGCKELCSSVELDILEYLSVNYPVKQCLESKLLCSTIMEMDLISLIEGSDTEESSALWRANKDADSIWSVSSILFEGLQFVDLGLSLFLEAFFNSAIVNEEETLANASEKPMNFRTFNEIVSDELILLDNSFKSMPVPIISDQQKTTSLHMFLDKVLTELKPQAFPTSDGIYLDLYLLEEDYITEHLSQLTMPENIDSYSINSFLNSSEHEVLMYDLVSSGESSVVPKRDEDRKILNVLSGTYSVADLLVDEVVSIKWPNDRYQKGVYGEDLSANNSEKVSSFFGSMSQFSDLDFFLNPRESSARKNSKSTNGESDIEACFSTVPSADSISAMQSQKRDYKLYLVKLSDDILALTDKLLKSYLTIFKNDTEIRNSKSSFSVADDTTLLNLSKDKLISYLRNASVPKTSPASIDDNRLAIATLCAIKQIAWYLCYYGIHSAYLYVDKLCQSMQCLNLRLSFLHNLIEDAHEKAGKGTPNFHPSLCVFHEILESRISQGHLKALIVAEQVFWWSLKKLLTSMKISCYELKNIHLDTREFNVSYETMDTKIEAAFHCDCCLVSHEYISPSFPFNKFAIILEYGGSFGSSKISTISSKLDGFPLLYFLKVEVEESSLLRAFFVGVDMPKDVGFRTEGDIHSFTTNEECNKLEELLNYIPMDENCGIRSLDAADEIVAYCETLPDPCMGLEMEFEQIERSMAPSPNNVIIVNTDNFDQGMIISRRSTYQKILAMEKEGTQVVERDLNLPVDVIVSANVCLAWYDRKNISKKATASKVASSSLPLCVENIAATIMTLLSFTFSGCILVFEGDSDFLAGIMENSDELCAAAASLGINLQIFCSYSCEMTDEIIVSCIKYATKFARGLYPKMPESETLIESFLTTFPSINPLSAHAILSSGCALLEFLKWSHDRRVYAVQQYHVSCGSISLFSALCRYGEREDSKSGMTDCSSSMTSVPDSENYPLRSDLGKRKRKSTESTKNVDKTNYDVYHVEPFKMFMDGGLIPPKASKPDNSWMSKILEIFDEVGKPGLSNYNFFGQRQGLDVNKMKYPFVQPPLHDHKMSTDEISDRIKRKSSSLNDMYINQNEGVVKVAKNNLAWHKDNFGDPQEDFMAEVIDVCDSSPLNKNFSFANPKTISSRVPEMHKDSGIETSRTARRLSFGSSCPHTSPAWISVGDQGQSLAPGIRQYSEPDFKDELLPQKILEEDIIHKRVENVHNLSKEVPNFGHRTLSNAIHSTNPQEGSPWTAEFLNGIREKSRLRQQSLTCELSTSCPRYSADILKVRKRRSPSIIDLHRYRGHLPKENTEQKRRKHSLQSSSSLKNNKTSASILSSWTPIDKRERRTTFATNGIRYQSKLVWSDQDSHSRV